ncbi:hypothetical protein ASE98_18565 [Pseudomonas sp. Leaf48]|nr:hypothetical protein ASE98_18565 [Pseudomonas sp. Leaf48]
MPNRHEVLFAKRASQPVRMRHFGRHKCREPAITEEVGFFLNSSRKRDFLQKQESGWAQLRLKKGDFSRYTVADSIPEERF